MKSNVLHVVLMLVVAGGAALPIATRASASQVEVGGGDVEPSREREAAPLPLRRVEAADEWFGTRVPAKPREARVPVDGQGRSVATLDIGAEHPVECSVTREATDPPLFLREHSAQVFEHEPKVKALGSIEKILPERIESGAIGSVPYMGLEWVVVGTEREGRTPLLGVHLIYAVKDGAGIACTKVDVGFRGTFVRVFEAFVSNFVFAEPPMEGRTVSIFRRSMGDYQVGLEVTTARTVADGDLELEQAIHTLLPKRDEPLEAVTVRERESIDGKDLSLRGRRRTMSRNGRAMLDLRLDWSKERGRWTVRGERDGASVDATLPEASHFTSSLATRRALREAMESENAAGRVVESWTWNVRDPAVATRSTLRVVELIDAKTARIVATDGGDEIESIVERPTGERISAKLVKDGRPLLSVERVYLGELPSGPGGPR